MKTHTKKKAQEQRFGSGLTVGVVLKRMLPRMATRQRACPAWPADVFAVATSLLLQRGAYASILQKWPPKTSSTWVSDVRLIGDTWRTSWPKVPKQVGLAWSAVAAESNTLLKNICKNRRLLEYLVLLTACADEACSRVGLPNPSLDPAETPFYDHALDLILEGSDTEVGIHGATLCKEIHPEIARVLPKMHTPQSGMTIRSLSLNLGLVLANEIIPRWHFLPEQVGPAFNVLFVPWPLKVDDGAVRSCAPNDHEIDNMAAVFDFFTFAPKSSTPTPLAHLKTLLRSDSLKGVRIHAVIYPELAVTDKEFDVLSSFTERKDMLLIAGVRVSTKVGAYARNEVRVSAPGADTFVQQKHHRWKIDEGQIGQYHLGTSLDARKQWWEHIDISSREFMFYAARDGLVISTLICEDLARPDPVGDLVRAVGPNLVIALLMDGPQIKARWPGRYAASLADDPGSTVLSLTSLGMSDRSLPKKLKDIGTKRDRRRVVALWQSPFEQNYQEIELSVGAEAILLPLVSKTRTEWAADGRDDGGKSAYLDLSKPIMVMPKKASA